MTHITENKIRRRFSRAGESYDDHCGLHKTIAQTLLSRLRDIPMPSAVLDVGCGTGYLTSLLKERFAQSKIIGLDFAEGMLKAAQARYSGIAWVQADGCRLPFGSGNFDLLVSNLAYQWSLNLADSFAEAKRVLTHEGAMACTLFGYHTCSELFQCLDESGLKGLKFFRLPAEANVRSALTDAGFKNYTCETDRQRTVFKDLNDLMVWLKSIGANSLQREGFIGRQGMMRASAIYDRRYRTDKGIQVTFEVIRVYAQN